MNDLTEVELYWQQGRIERLQERILMPPSLARLVQKLPITRGDDWSALLPVAVDPKPATEGTSGDDPDNSWIRREATLPEYEAIAPESLQLADPFAILVDDADDESVRADMLHQRMRTIARQASLDPGDGLGLRGAMKEQFTVYLEPNLMQALTEYAERRGKPKSLVAEAAIASFLSPDSAEWQEAALARRLDRITRQSPSRQLLSSFASG
jgi:predicted transcriptional regulator